MASSGAAGSWSWVVVGALARLMAAIRSDGAIDPASREAPRPMFGGAHSQPSSDRRGRLSQELAPSPHCPCACGVGGLGCPGFKGPVPLPVSMDGRSLPAPVGACQSLYPHIAIYYFGHVLAPHC